jgi:UDP-2,3-diacylglucosamine pyrophosphatase LpxH
MPKLSHRQRAALRKLDRSPVAQADGVKETAEDRAAEIAEHIGECAREMNVKPCDLTWHDFRAYAGIVYGENKIGIVRRDITRLGGYNRIRDSYFPPAPTDHAGTRLQLRQHANLNRKVGRDATQITLVMEEVERLSKRLFTGRVKPIKVQYPTAGGKQSKLGRRVVTLNLSDLHFGSDLKAAETGFLDYGKTEEARRLAFVVKQACEYKPEYRAVTHLRLNLLGDLIHGKLHDQVDGAVLAEQISRAIHLLTQAVAHLATHFPTVSVECVTGNHGRNLTRHFGRATVGKYDSHETVIYSAIKNACRLLPNVKFSIPLRPFGVYSDFGKKVFVTHGDTVLRPGNPGKSINTAGLETQINRWNASLSDNDEYAVFIMGHVHTPMTTQLANGAYVVTNGCLIPADNFCVSIGIPETICSQILFESVAGYPVGDLRMISLAPSVDKMEKLDEIIQPWSEF